MDNTSPSKSNTLVKVIAWGAVGFAVWSLLPPEWKENINRGIYQLSMGMAAAQRRKAEQERFSHSITEFLQKWQLSNPLPQPFGGLLLPIKDVNVVPSTSDNQTPQPQAVTQADTSLNPHLPWLNSIVKIRDSEGLEVGSIICPQKWSDRIIPESIGHNSFGFMTTTHKRNVWKDPDAVILWTWRQIVSSSFFMKDLLNGGKPIICVACGEKSVILKMVPIVKNRWRGITCNNPKCPMYSVLIPAGVFGRHPPQNILDKLGVDIIEKSEKYSNPTIAQATNNTIFKNIPKQDDSTNNLY